MEAKLVFPDWWKGDFKPLTFCGGGVVSISFRKQHIEHTIQHSLCMKHTASEPLTISLLAHEREVQVPMWKILSVLIPYICIVPVTMIDLFPGCSFSHATNKLSKWVLRGQGVSYMKKFGFKLRILVSEC